MTMRTLLVFICYFLSACSSMPAVDNSLTNTAPISLPPAPLLDDKYFGEPLPVLTVAQGFSLSNAQKQDFQSSLNNSMLRSLRPGKQIYKYIEKHLQNFNYHAENLKCYAEVTATTQNQLNR